MEKEIKLWLLEEIINNKNEAYINALYEIVVNGDYDYLENLFPTKEDFKKFIEKYKGEE